MKKSNLLLIAFVCLFSLFTCRNRVQPKLDMENVFAWCVVPFDAKQRTPAQRIDMLKNLGLKRYAYDWREKHLDEMAEEWMLAQKNGIEVMAVWMWIDSNQDSVGNLSPANEKVLQAMDSIGLKTTLWVSFNHNFFENLADSTAIAKGAAMIDYLAGRGYPVWLYNHGDWYGEPGNQIAIIKALPQHQLGLVYSFHHAHKQLDRFPELIDTMLPYLKAVNLNGMKTEGPQILPVGKGEHEKQMIRVLLDKGYNGPLGILGHVEDADVELILKGNLEGLEQILGEVGGKWVVTD